MTLALRTPALIGRAAALLALSVLPAIAAGVASGSSAGPDSSSASGSLAGSSSHTPLPTFSPWSGSGVSAGHGHFVQRDGASLFAAICQGCHMPDARGAQGAGAYPALAGNVRLASVSYPITTVLHGRNGMPAFSELDDAQVAAVVAYVRTHFGNAYSDIVTAEDVARLRAIVP